MLSELPVGEEQDQQILMHRNAHFSGSWNEMMRYYREEGIGSTEDFSLSRMEALAELERSSGTDLFYTLCSPDQVGQVEQALSAYKLLRNLYALSDGQEGERAQLLADLILAEGPELAAVQARCVAQGAPMVPLLLGVVEESSYLNALWPGYGQAPMRASEVLGRIGDARAVVPLFELLVQLGHHGEQSFDTEQAAIEALAKMGDQAKHFLLRMLDRRPLGNDHLIAAMALCNFVLDAEQKQPLEKLHAEGVEGPLKEYVDILLGTLDPSRDRATDPLPHP